MTRTPRLVTPPPQRPRRIALPALLLTSLGAGLLALASSACGAGGVGPTAPGLPSAAEVEAASFQLVNQARQTAGVRLLVLDPGLSAIARAHSESMRDHGFFDHRDPTTGKTFTDRLRDGGQTFHTAGENLAMVANAGDPAGFAHTQLLASPEHRADMLNPSFNRVGLGVARSGSTYWITQLFVGD